MIASQSETDIEPPLPNACALLDRNSRKLLSTIKWCIVFSLLRLTFAFLSFFFSQQLITTDIKYQSAGALHIIYYVISILMDFIVLINEISMWKRVSKDRRSVIIIINCLKQGDSVSWVADVGNCIQYFSIYNVIKRYRFGTGRDSITDSIRILQETIVFPFFAIPALASQHAQQAPIYKILILWAYMFSIYFTTFEMDYSQIEESDGPYMVECHSENQAERKFFLEEDIKRNFIKKCIRPPQILIILGVCLLTLVLLLTLSITAFTGIIFSCVVSHIALLTHERTLQQQLYEMNLNLLPYQFLNPFKIMSVLKKYPRWCSLLCRMCRSTAILTCFALCYMAKQLYLLEALLLVGGLGLLVFAHYWRLDINQNIKLYVIETRRFEDLQLSELGTPKDKMICAICLLSFVQNPTKSKVIKLPCFPDHVFHQDCLKGWLRMKNICPLCRSPLHKYRFE